MKNDILNRSGLTELLPRSLGNTGVRYAPGVAAGDWVFATGLSPYDLLADGAALPQHREAPVRSETVERSQARATFDLLEQTLAAAGSDVSSLVRFDQYYTTPKAVDAYHQERSKRLGGRVPPSTSMLMSKLLVEGAHLDIQALGVRGDRARGLEFFNHPVLNGPATSGFCAAVRSDEFVFVPGFTPSAQVGQPSRRGLAIEATMPEGSQWKGTPIELETKYLIEAKLGPALALAGASLKGMCKAQVYLTDPDDVLGFLRVWTDHVGADGPALTIVVAPHRSIAVEDCRLEVNAIAVTDAALSRRKVIDAGLPRWLEAAPNAIRVGELLFLSGLMPLDAAGRMVKPTPHPSLGRVEDRVADQTVAILERAARICAAAGTSLANVLRLQFFMADLGGFPSVQGRLAQALPGRALSCSFIEAPAPAFPAGALLHADLWVFCPQEQTDSN